MTQKRTNIKDKYSLFENLDINSQIAQIKRNLKQLSVAINKKQKDIDSLKQKIYEQNDKLYYLKAVAIKNEVEKQGYVFDKSWAQTFVQYKIKNWELKQLKLKDIYIDDWQDTKMGTPVKIKDSPNYKYLCGDKKDYITRCQNEPSHSCETFDKLIQLLETNGIDNTKIISVDQDNHIIDGAHRASWLAYKYGEDYEITVLKIYFDKK